MLTSGAGVRFGLRGPKSARPAPTLLVLANSLEDTLGDPYFRQGGNQLAEQGYLCASLDLPCHGQERREAEPEGLHGWRHRFDLDEDFLGEFIRRARDVLDHLVEGQYTDPRRIAVTGASRGGFAALHLMAADPRIKCAALMGPVTALTALEEFRSLPNGARADALSLAHLADRLAGRAVWIVIGDQDERVGTDLAIALARKLSAAAHSHQLMSRVELHVLPEPRGHTTPAEAAEASARWIARKLNPRDARLSGGC